MNKYICLILSLFLTISLFTGCTKAAVLTFDSQGGSEVAPVEIKSGNPVGFPNDPTKQGFYFAGWFTSPDGNGVAVKDGAFYTSSVTLYAYWVSDKTELDKTNKITISLNLNNGECEKTEVLISPGSVIGDLPTPTKNGNSFTGWYTDNSTEEIDTLVTPEKTFTENTTVYARWRRIWTLKFSAQEAQNQEELTPIKVLDKGTPVGLPTPVREGYKFLYWYYTSNNTQTEVNRDFSITNDYTLSAKWEKI